MVGRSAVKVREHTSDERGVFDLPHAPGRNRNPRPQLASQMSRPLFHADSEEEEEDPLGQSSKPNFFGDSDDEDEEMQPEPDPVSAPQKRAREELDEDDVIEEIPPPSASWRARSPPKDGSSSSAVSSPNAIDEDDEIEEESPPAARSSPPSKKRRISPPTSVPVLPAPGSSSKQDVDSTVTKAPYLGEMIIAEAWATTTGKSLLANGDAVHIHKELKDEPSKNTSKDASKSTKGKQMKLTSMMKKAPPKPAKKQVEGAIVRFSNSRGQEIGRLPSKTSSWISRLLDNNVVDIQGIVVDCPPKIQTGCHIMLSLRFYLRPSAFIKPNASLMYQRSRTKEWDLMPEGAETAEEKNLSERKRSLSELFDALSLRPRHQKPSAELDSALAFTKEKKPKGSSSSAKGKQKAVEVIGEGEDAEEAELEGEELTGQELNAIYKKAQLHDREMPEMDPASSFALVLRPYQRQALRWMCSIESGSRDARDASSMHPLWEESDFAFFKSSITTPFLNQDPKCLDVVQIVLESVLLRREKTMKDRDGRSIVSLPPKEVKTETLEFSPAERKIYDSIYADAKHAYDAFNARGVVGKNMSNILAMLMKLRQAVLHPSLIRRRLLTDEETQEDAMETNAEGDGKNIDVDALIDQFSLGAAQEEVQESKTFAIGVLKDLESIETQECPLCLDTVQDPMLVPECHHALCKECIVDLIQDQEAKGNEGFCPVCQHKPVTERSLIEVTVRRKVDASIPTSSPAVTLRQNDFVSSTKLDALVRHLRRLREEEPAFRAIVFSQFTRFLDLIQTVLKREGFPGYRLDGSLNQKQRTQVLQEFAEPSLQPKVFAISLKAGGVGLNLTNANYVFMMDSWWNSAVEQQAIDRVHRIGQDKKVYVTHFLVSRTIEERIVAIQKRKTAIVKSALGSKGKSEQETFENLRIMFSG
ncbi:DNA helicase rad5 [Tulasnella sp. 417]|nr:DNA helicase rad5 [Tulasnella sp. 417]